MVLLALLACAPPPTWSEAGALAPTRARMDADGDGRVSALEYEAVRFRGPPFAKVDADGDAAISDAELLALVLEKDPTALSPTRPSAKEDASKRRRQNEARANEAAGRPAAPAAAQQRADAPADDRTRRLDAAALVRSVLLALKEEIAAVDPERALPTEEAIKAAASTADLRTVESRAVLAELEAASDAVALPFPAPLRAAALAAEPIVASVPLDEGRREGPRVRLGRDGNPIPPGGEDLGPGSPPPEGKAGRGPRPAEAPRDP